MSNSSGFGNNLRKTILSIKEIIGNNHSDDDIYTVLKESRMDPNDATQKLLLLGRHHQQQQYSNPLMIRYPDTGYEEDPFHEVKRKRDRKKETAIKEARAPRWKPGMQGWGNHSSRHISHEKVDAGSSKTSLSAKENETNKGADDGAILPTPKDNKNLETSMVASSSIVVSDKPFDMGAEETSPEVASSLMQEKTRSAYLGDGSTLISEASRQIARPQQAIGAQEASGLHVSSSSSKITTFIKESKDLVIPFQVIEEATKNFTIVLGKGGYGYVYKGELLLSGELTSIAVKRLDSRNMSGQGFKEFLTEIQLLSRYKHPNVVSLLGFCDEAGEKILIYEYAEYGSLDKHISVAKKTRPLTWEQRISICLDIARGLEYLHNRIPKNHRVIHRDIKSANILIGHDWKGMIADLGLSKIGRANESDSYLITNASGTHGYCDPAYMDTGILTKESDVYSFGVVMFELLCGRLAFMHVNSEHRFLARLAHCYYETGKLDTIIDPYLKIEVDSDSLKRFSEIAYTCLLKERNERPSMGLVVQKLEEMMASYDSHS